MSDSAPPWRLISEVQNDTVQRFAGLGAAQPITNCRRDGRCVRLQDDHHILQPACPQAFPFGVVAVVRIHDIDKVDDALDFERARVRSCVRFRVHVTAP
jgi:hypothetical protein